VLEDLSGLDSSTKVRPADTNLSRRQSIRRARKPEGDQIFPLLTLTEACVRFGITNRRLYHLVSLRLVHPVQPHGRVLYPEWEIEAALRAVSIGRLLFDQAIAAVA